MNGAARTLLVLALASLPWGCASDDAWPSSPITIVCPWSAGGGTDQVSRQIALYLEEDLGVPVAVVNAVGGAGVTGHATGARARPDGTTLLMATVELNMLHWRDLTRLTWEDYAHLALLNRDAAAIFVRSDSPWSTAAELLDAARTTPGRLRASGTSTGGIWHLALAGWLVSEGLPPDAIRWISSAGAGPSLNELASRGVDVVCASVPEARSFLEGSKDRPAVARALGVMSERPVRGYESIPTFPSLGFDWTLEGWRGLVAPKGTPEPIVAKLRASLERILLGEVKAGDRTFVEAMRAQTFDASWGRADEFRTLLAATDEKLGRLLTSPDFVALDDKSFPLHAFPGAIALLLALAIGLTAIERARARRSATSEGEGSRRAASGIERRGLIHFGEVIVGVVLWIALAETLGFTITTSLLLVALFLRFSVRPVLAIAISGILVPLVFFVFANELGVSLPRGPWGW